MNIYESKRERERDNEKMYKKWKAKGLLTRIEKADGEQLECIIRCILSLYKKDYSETECIFLAIPRKDWNKRERTLKTVCSILMAEDFVCN